MQTTTELNHLANEALSIIEIAEARQLNWGFINGFQSAEDLARLLAEYLTPIDSGNSPLTLQQILDNLCERKLLLRGGTARAPHYRSRFAETVRTLFLLRQRFSDEDWRTGDRLVGDLKLLPQRRRYPRRDQPTAQILERFTSRGASPLAQQVMAALSGTKSGQPLVLAQFQVDAVEQILASLVQSQDRAIVVGAGTGSGKTLAFYLPALTHLAQSIAAQSMNDAARVHTLALYPRKELLKDQLNEVFQEARKIDSLLQRAGKRPIRIGAYFGDVPNSAEDLDRYGHSAWPRSRYGAGYVCPYLRCPECEEQILVWREEDVKAEIAANKAGKFDQYARLHCPRCDYDVGSDRLLLTRRQMVRQPPDILFTTTEMLNRRLSHQGEHKLFGIGCDTPPRLLLMDEIHLHDGIYGAQIAYLLRRWRHARGHNSEQSLCIVGLSATLSNAEHFFARLTGIAPAQVRYITPAPEELIEEGMEYNVVLKGDPAAGTTLLSTSVRTAGLICRIMDPMNKDVSGGTYGKRVFAFSDKLDVINRWYHIEREVENPREPYSRYLFVPRGARDAQERYHLGQNWRFVSDIHHSSDVLTSGLLVDITSSQYQGVDTAANLVIASSTLEVGYNDSTVGAVIQHKTPMSRAAFLQRKGRAGRPRAMRPWMILVTSAYGFDRWAFQHPESLFDPLLAPLDLPLENYYILKIQAAYALMDWLALSLTHLPAYPSVRDLLAGRPNTRNAQGDRLREELLLKLNELLQQTPSRQALRTYLQDALQLEYQAEYILDTLLWGEPRPLLLQVIPTLIRQLESHWQCANFDVDDDQWHVVSWEDDPSDRPLPDFVPAALFSDLKSPEIHIRIPEPQRNRTLPPTYRTGEPETLSQALAMSEYAPGKVNKRFAHKDRIREAHWLEIPPTLEQALDLRQFQIVYEPVAPRVTVPIAQGSAQESAGLTVQLLRPRRIDLSLVPRHVRPTSSGSFRWASQFILRTRYSDQSQSVSRIQTPSGLPLQIRHTSPWQPLFTKIHAYTQAESQWVEVTRAAIGVDVYTRYEQGGEHRASYTFQADGIPAAIGFQIDADALAFTLAPVDPTWIRSQPEWPMLYREYAPQFYFFLLANDERTRDLHISGLELEWLWQVTLAMLTTVAVEQSVTLQQAATIVGQSPKYFADQVLSTLLGGTWDLKPDQQVGRSPAAVTNEENNQLNDLYNVDLGGGDNEGEDDQWAHAPAVSAQAVPQLSPHNDDSTVETEEVSYLHSKLLNLLLTPSIWAMLAEHAQVLWDDSHPELDAWLQELYRHSMGATLYSALLAMAPEIQNDDLHMDVDGNIVWLSEAAAGGVGLIAKLLDLMANRPQHFDLQMHHAIHHCPRQELAAQLHQVVTLVSAQNPELEKSFDDLRHAHDLLHIEQTRLALAKVLDGYGVALTRSLTIALNTKFLRPNSDRDSDQLIANLQSFWQNEQARLAIAIDLRVIAVVAAQRSEFQQAIDDVLRRISATAGPASTEQAYNLLTSLLWLDCQDGCPDCIGHPQRYQRGPRPSRALLKLFVKAEETLIHASDTDWPNQLHRNLTERYEAILVIDPNDLATSTLQLVNVLATPVETLGQLLYPTLQQVERLDGAWRLHFALADLAQG